MFLLSVNLYTAAVSGSGAIKTLLYYTTTRSFVFWNWVKGGHIAGLSQKSTGVMQQNYVSPYWLYTPSPVDMESSALSGYLRDIPRIYITHPCVISLRLSLPGLTGQPRKALHNFVTPALVSTVFHHSLLGFLGTLSRCQFIDFSLLIYGQIDNGPCVACLVRLMRL